MRGLSWVRRTILGPSEDVPPSTTPGALFKDLLLTNRTFEMLLLLLVVSYLLILLVFFLSPHPSHVSSSSSSQPSRNSDLATLYSSLLLVVASAAAFGAVSKIATDPLTGSSALTRTANTAFIESLQTRISSAMARLTRSWLGTRLVSLSTSSKAGMLSSGLSQANNLREIMKAETRSEIGTNCSALETGITSKNIAKSYLSCSPHRYTSESQNLAPPDADTLERARSTVEKLLAAGRVDQNQRIRSMKGHQETDRAEAVKEKEVEIRISSSGSGNPQVAQATDIANKATENSDQKMVMESKEDDEKVVIVKESPDEANRAAVKGKETQLSTTQQIRTDGAAIIKARKVVHHTEKEPDTIQLSVVKPKHAVTKPLDLQVASSGKKLTDRKVSSINSSQPGSSRKNFSGEVAQESIFATGQSESTYGMADLYCDAKDDILYVKCLKEKIRLIEVLEQEEIKYFKDVRLVANSVERESKEFLKRFRVFTRRAALREPELTEYNASPRFYVREVDKLVENVKMAFPALEIMKALERRDGMAARIVGKYGSKVSARDGVRVEEKTSLPTDVPEGAYKRDLTLRSIQFFLFFQLVLGLVTLIALFCFPDLLLWTCKLMTVLFLGICLGVAIYLVLLAHISERNCILRDTVNSVVDRCVTAAQLNLTMGSSYDDKKQKSDVYVRHLKDTMALMKKETSTVSKAMREYFKEGLEQQAVLQIQGFQEFLRRLFFARNSLESSERMLDKKKNGEEPVKMSKESEGLGDMYADASALYRSLENFKGSIGLLSRDKLLNFYVLENAIEVFLQRESDRVEGQVAVIKRRVPATGHDERCARIFRAFCDNARTADRTAALLLFSAIVLCITLIL